MFLACVWVRTLLECSLAARFEVPCGPEHTCLSWEQAAVVQAGTSALGESMESPACWSRVPEAQIQTHVEMSCNRCSLCVPVFVGWGQMSFLAVAGTSNCVCSAALAEQPNHVWSFGEGEELPFLQGGSSAECEVLPCAPTLGDSVINGCTW